MILTFTQWSERQFEIDRLYGVVNFPLIQRNILLILYLESKVSGI
ncbi:hypothetical protein SAMN05421863_11072 [Nitrosomonas communis]|uniref:Uncharacterized protein n=1 Tax=Nitrosomonas communis TaxID=44574 RepID=A0A1I4WFF8_9PROT|nr:hypothetical protein SAMN05421863_11072 [Nitrosomonas communis]